VPNNARQKDLFESEADKPEGLRYAPQVISAAEEQELLKEMPALPFREFQFQGFVGKRRTVSFGWHYDFNGGGLRKASEMPQFLQAVREQAAGFAGVDVAALEHALVIEYSPDAAIGWHRDRPQFGDVIGVSLLSPCTFRLRRKRGTKWQRHSFTAAPRSAYLLHGPSRSEWEHSIPPQEALRYSITFRTLAARKQGALIAGDRCDQESVES
jgi:alkylated DNA repair dioxygenase AlkB